MKGGSGTHAYQAIRMLLLFVTLLQPISNTSVFFPTLWPVFNKEAVLGRFLSSSINGSLGVTQGRERGRERLSIHERGRVREREMEGNVEENR